MPEVDIFFALPKIPQILDNKNFEQKQEIKKQQDNEINDEIDPNRLKDETDADEIPGEIEFYFRGRNYIFFLMYSKLNLSQINENFIDFLSSDISSQILRESTLSIHIGTGNISYENYNINELIFDFLLRQQDETKKIIHATLTYKDSFSNYLRYFLDNIDTETVDKSDFFTNKNVKYHFYMFSDYSLFSVQNTVRVRHSKIVKSEIVMKEVQNREWQYLVESVIQLSRATKTIWRIYPKVEKR